VYSPALLALKRRRKEIERYLAEEAQKRRQELTTCSAVSVCKSHGQSLYTHNVTSIKTLINSNRCCF
jgi:hypothetical protein